MLKQSAEKWPFSARGEGLSNYSDSRPRWLVGVRRSTKYLFRE